MKDTADHKAKGSLKAYWSGRKIEGVVFDVDGTLTNSIEAYFEVFRQATAQFGIEVKREDVLEPMATGALIWDRAIPNDITNRDEKVRQVVQAIPGIYFEVFKQVQPFSGLEPILKALKEVGIMLGAMTSSWAPAVRPLHDHSLAHYFTTIITHEDGFPHKPAPDGILECLRRMKTHPNHALTVGDSPVDIRAGKAAGTLTVGVLSGIASRAQLEPERPTAIIENVSHLLALMNLK